ncbi:MAG TPA: restriction endonuclease, partial [Ruminococcaceae bacterium]|nr:restriction endonuclease [Oscillospiraceae bacterium]
MAMRAPHIQATNVVVPMIYAYTTPEIARHDGWTKIGYTEQNVETRINQQTHTGDIRWQLEWKGNAVFDDGSGEAFSDKMFHAYLRKNGIEQEAGTVNEWFKISGSDSRQRFFDFRVTRGLDNDEHEIAEYHLRAEQEQAVSQAAAYLQAKQGTEFLWNAKPRFGKTLSVYDFAKRIGAEKELVVTNRPAVANSWYRDYYDFIGPQSGYFFVSHVDEIAKCPGVMSYEAFAADKKARQSQIYDDATAMGIIYFASLQDLKGSVYFGGDYEKRREISTIKWDLLVIDEAHEGVDTYKTDAAFDRIARRFTLHLSGTPFKALANNKFPDNAIFNWTYADEQRSKRDWNDADGENPYANLPKLNLFTYQMSEIVRDELKKGIEIDGVNADYAFDLNEFFRVDQKGQFVYNRSVDRFLDALATQTRFPFSTPELRAELKHTFWMLNRVESARALAKKLAEHPVFHEYHIVLAAGDGRIDDEDETRKAFDKVTEAIRTHEKTITLSVGQLSTGVTVPEWTAVLMLSNMKSPSLYMQAAFRAQNPCLFREGTAFKRKQNAYVFDFDPARTLTVFEEFANDLNADTASGKGDIETRERHIRELLNFFPVIGEDENSELIELNPEQVLTIPRKIRSVEVVKRGFMCNFLFQNISSIFSAPQAVVDIITHFQPQEEGKIKNSLQDDLKNDLSINKNGDIDLDDDILIGLADDMFGDKLFSDVVLTMENAAAEIASQDQVKDSDNKRLREMLTDTAVSGIVDTIEKTYGDDFKKGDKKQLQSQLEHKAEKLVNKVHGNFRTDVKVAEADRLTAMKNRYETGLTQEEIEAAFQKAKRAAVTKFEEEMKKGVEHFVEEASVDAVKQTETKKQNREKQSIEDTVRQHLRGFART